MSLPEDDAVIPLSLAPTVLVVDDELTPRSIICRMVRGMGYQVRTARNGREALRYLKQHPGEVHLVLTDVIMPYMDGGELAERARDLDPSLKLILMSGYPRGEIADLLGAYPELPFLEKPVAFGRLYELLGELLGVVGGPPSNPRRTSPARYRSSHSSSG
ncbi:MAG TPA: response regulator [Gemmatimonadales bacterium]|jgi:two-component system cell cycle sensor histidine kinase/response regulator CckA|nr:response regulator [Gemmatimonadales bacterium]